ncbi:hypothetical protein FH972_024234 [Carpinus fangiana]|uniref:Borealin N-terminal domain-containing protein n=1 Tax=Carpinus fangiana TaxID=176857 RepID=A0A5N6KXZ0_9ROSI|nr:hypothetical protein FH972_024234 [Carpinus fangiana]
MAPKRTSKRKSSSGTSVSDTQNQLARFPAPPQLLPTKTGSPAGSPFISPSKRRTGVTQGQRQIFMENLQAEKANRRAQWLRSNLEYRIIQIPSAVRKATLGEVLLKYMEQNAAASPKRVAPKPRPAKRNSTHILEDNPAPTSTKRPRLEGAKVATSAAAKRAAESRILSPKSHNSRALPQSPFKAMGSPLKSGIARPFSPVKSVPGVAMATTASSLAKTNDKTSSLAKANDKTSSLTKANDKTKAKTAPRTLTKQATKPTTASTASTASMRSKRAPAAKTRGMTTTDDSDGRRQSNESNATTNSTGTAIITKQRATKGVNKAVADSRIVGIPAAGKKVKATSTSTAKAVGSVRGGRTLRNRP